VVKGFDRLTRTGIAVLFVGIILVFSVGLAFTQSPEFANPFVDTFNFNTVESVFPMLRIGDDPRRGTGTVGTAPPSGEFIDCNSALNLPQGEFCSDILQTINANCFLKQNIQLRFVTGDPRDIGSPNFDTIPLLTPSLSLIDPRAGREIVTFNVEPRVACDVPMFKDGTRLPFGITAQDTKIFVKASAYDEDGIRQTIISQRQITVPIVVFDDSQDPSPIDGKPLFIASERPLGDVNFSADEIERALNPSRDFNSRIEFELSGLLFIEIPDLDTSTQKFVVQHTIKGDPIKTTIDFNVDIAEPAPEVDAPSGKTLLTTVTSVQPDNLVTDGNSNTIKKVNIFFKMNDYTSAEGQPDCEVRKQDTSIFNFFGQPLLANVKGVKQSTSGFDTNFTCEIPVTGDTQTGTYEAQISTPAMSGGQPTRATTTTTFSVSLQVNDDGGGGGGTAGDPCPSVASLRETFKGLTDKSLLQLKANLQQGIADAEATACDLIKFPLVIGELDTRGLSEEPTPNPQDDPSSGNTCTAPAVFTKIGEGQFTCVDPSPAGGLFTLPKFIACAEGVTADTSAGEICVPPSLFAIIQWLQTGNNWIIALVAIIAVLIILKVIAVAIGRAKGGVVLKP